MNGRSGLGMIWGSVAICAGLTMVAGSAVAEAPWQGSEELRDGVLHVSNPPSPIHPPAERELRELWRVGGESEDEGQFFGVIGALDVGPDGTVFLLDRQLAEVKLFTADGEYIRTIGREGEGPGEFRGPSDIFLTPDGNVAVIQIMPGKIVLLSREGEPRGDLPLGSSEDGFRQSLWLGSSLGDRIVLESAGMRMDKEKAERTVLLASYSTQGDEISRFWTNSSELNFAKLEIDERKGLRPTWSLGPDGRVYAVTTFGAYEIRVFGPEGHLDRIVTREFEHLDRTSREMEEAKSGFIIRGPVDPTIYVSDYHPDIEGLYPQADGSLWVLTSRGSRDGRDGSIGTFDLFDARGRFVRQVTLLGEGNPVEDQHVFSGDRLYVLRGYRQALKSMHAMDDRSNSRAAEEEEDEEARPMEVICYALDGLIADKSAK